ncbi:MAG: sigma-54-dependent Fis family transcriptional regulator [Bacteroidales bacterium]|nr:sigma-54-dependent Fis family transcriptional regulator [Bacteroidales bacterium]
MDKRSGSILVIEDDQDVLFTARAVLRKRFQEVICEDKPDRIPAHLAERDIDVVLLDMNFRAGETSGREGLHWLKRILEIDPDVKVLMTTAYGDIQLAVESMKQGAVDFLVKPWERQKLVATVDSVFQLKKAQRQLNQYRSAQKIADQHEPLLGKARSMQPVFETIEKVAPTDANILLLGENGTGKDLIAKALHNKSDRQDMPFVKVDLGALSENLFESELFGHVKGAFTDAREDRLGRFEVADGGTLFLDEIGNLSAQLQSKLLSAIQNHSITRLGSNREIATDVRLICATNKPIYDMVAREGFRQDLLYRINTVEIPIPPLRERKEDISLLANHFLEHISHKYNKNILTLGNRVMDKLTEYHWPGNVRELHHAIERAVIMCEGDRLELGDFALKPVTKEQREHELNVKHLERDTIRQAIEACKGNLSKASQELGLSRSTLYRKIKKYGL